MHSAEVAVAKAQAAADGKREVEKEVAEIRKYKDFRERNEEIYKIALELAEKAREKEDYRTAATCLAQAVAATGQIKPLAIDPNKPDQDDKPGIDRAIEEMKARNDARNKSGA